MRKIALAVIMFFTIINVTAQCWQAVAPGWDHTIAIKSDGTLWAWGNNVYGQIGDGTTTTRTSPVQIGSGTNWASVATGESSSIAIKTDGTLWTWGRNQWGQLGDGTTTTQTAPLQLGSATDWASATIGNYHTLAIKTNGTLWAWGYNASGQLGNGNTTNQFLPVQVTGTAWVFVSAGGHYTLARKTGGTLWAWGVNNNGQLGDGTTTNKSSPIQITGTDWASVSAGGYHTLAIKTGGTLWAWGWNTKGQVGDGTIIQRNSPVQIGAGTDWATVSAGGQYTVGKKTAGTLWGWGYNLYGEIGDGTTAQKNSPVQIGSGTDWASVYAAKGYHTFSLKTSPALWAWGNNSGGQLGDGTGIQKTSPVLIGSTCSVVPIKLLSFEAAKNANHTFLIWKTISELNTDKFEIERSIDGQLFNYLGEVKAAGNSNTIKHYNILDKNAGLNFPDQTLYYRIKQFDLDSNYSYSPVRSLKFRQKPEDIQVYPSPAKNIITIKASTEWQGMIYSITDRTGTQILTGCLSNSTRVDITRLSAGIYFVKVGKLSKQILKD